MPSRSTCSVSLCLDKVRRGGNEDICSFCRHYLCSSWFETPLPAAAPANDLAFFKPATVLRGQSSVKGCSQSILQTSVVLEQGVSLTCFLRPQHLSCHKEGYGQGIGSGTLERSEDPAKRIEIDMVSSSIEEKTAANFAIQSSGRFFEILNLPTECLAVIHKSGRAELTIRRG